MYTILWYKCTGERKAIFEDCESEKTENKDRIKKLKDEVRDLQAEVQASNKSSEGILRHVQVGMLLSTIPSIPLLNRDWFHLSSIFSIF